jgi:hypothetical protein
MKQARSLWWFALVWIISVAVLGVLHSWALRDSEVASALLAAYLAVAVLAITWGLGRLANYETERRNAGKSDRA